MRMKMKMNPSRHIYNVYVRCGGEDTKRKHVKRSPCFFFYGLGYPIEHQPKVRAESKQDILYEHSGVYIVFIEAFFNGPKSSTTEGPK